MRRVVYESDGAVLLKPHWNFTFAARSVVSMAPQRMGCAPFRSLHDAAAAGDVAAVKDLLDDGADVDEPNRYQATALHIAAAKGHSEVCEVLLDRGANVNAVDDERCAPLHEAAWRGHYEVCRILLERGAYASARKKAEETPLHVAVYAGHPEICRLLIQHGAIINTKDGTPLHVAAREGNLTMCLLLLRHGADANFKDHKGRTALHVAAANDAHEDIIALLVESGANPDTCDDRNRVAAEFSPTFAARTKFEVAILRGESRREVDRDVHSDRTSSTSRVSFKEA